MIFEQTLGIGHVDVGGKFELESWDIDLQLWEIGGEVFQRVNSFWDGVIGVALANEIKFVLVRKRSDDQSCRAQKS